MDLYEDDSESTVDGNRSDDSDSDDDKDPDVDMSQTENSSDEKERVPKSGMFRMMAFSPPPPRITYRSLSKPSLYAITTAPTQHDMIDMFKRAAPLEPENHSSSMEEDDDYDMRNSSTFKSSSPSATSSSSRSSSRPRVPEPGADEISDDDESTLGSRWNRNRYERRPVRVAEPAVRHGEMVYCVWSRSMESAIFAPEKKYRYRYSDEDDDPVSSVKILWDARGPSIIDPELEAELMANKDGGKKVITLEDCMAEYTREEKLGEEDLWYCPRCKKHQQATKKLDIWRFPDILVVHLKRFSHTRAWRDKIDAMVDFPISGLDLGDKALSGDGKESVYDLFGVSNHMGGLGGGHCKELAIRFVWI
jgi:ubiquitin carboxyl-terminal hydrolase 4/11/15